MNTKFIDQDMPVEILSYEGMTHRFIGVGNMHRAWVWCLDCDSHSRDCPQFSPPHIRERYLRGLV